MRNAPVEVGPADLSVSPIEQLAAWGCPGSERALVGWLAPVIRTRAGRMLARRRHAGSRIAAFTSVDDLTQDVLVALFADDMRVLVRWDCQRGLSFKNYVGLVTERIVARSLRVRVGDRPFANADEARWPLDSLADSRLGPEGLVALRQWIACITAAARAELSEGGYKLFELLVLQDLSKEEVCQSTGLADSAVYAWRSRLLKITRRLAERTRARDLPAPGCSVPGAVREL